jgi:hypothetical protein
VALRGLQGGHVMEALHIIMRDGNVGVTTRAGGCAIVVNPGASDPGFTRAVAGEICARAFIVAQLVPAARTAQRVRARVPPPATARPAAGRTCIVRCWLLSLQHSADVIQVWRALTMLVRWQQARPR